MGPPSYMWTTIIYVDRRWLNRYSAHNCAVRTRQFYDCREKWTSSRKFD